MLRPPKEEAEKYSAYYKPDTEFSAFGRLLQSKWRDKKQYPFVDYGNFLPVEFAKTTKANFLTEKIGNLVKEEVKTVRGFGGMIGEPRIWNNLLSSQPLCFNLFGELALDTELATMFFQDLFPSKVSKVSNIKFEYSPGRATHHCDHSAFDVFVEYDDLNGNKCFIGIEVKYAECLKEESSKKARETFEKHKDAYTKLTTEDFFKPNAIEELQFTPLCQIWRDHLLTLSTRKFYDDGFFVFLYPRANKECAEGVKRYVKQLRTDNETETFFYPRHLEDFIRRLKSLHSVEWTTELAERYFGSTL